MFSSSLVSVFSQTDNKRRAKVAQARKPQTWPKLLANATTARQIEASSLSPFLAPQHPEAFLRGRTRVNLAKWVFVPNFLKCLKTF